MITIKNRKFDILGPNDFPVHRGFPLGNPFSHLPISKAEFRSISREASINDFRYYLKEQIMLGNKEIIDALNILIQKNLNGEDFGLVCYCSPHNRCHAEVIQKFIEEQTSLIDY